MSSRKSIACDVWLPAAIDEVWEFASNPKNLAEISPHYLGLKVKAESGLVEGSKVHMSFSPFGVSIPLAWVAVISEFKDQGEKRKFVDIQDKGPFAYWKHTHLFEAGLPSVLGERESKQIKNRCPGTWVRDLVEYEIPAGSAGVLLNKFFIKRELEKMFTYRACVLHKLFRSS